MLLSLQEGCRRRVAERLAREHLTVPLLCTLVPDSSEGSIKLTCWLIVPESLSSPSSSGIVPL